MHKPQGTLYLPKNLQHLFYDNILILKQSFSKITNKKKESKSHPIQNLTRIYNPHKFDNPWNIYDNTDRFPYVVAKSFYNSDINTPLFVHNRHTFLEKLNPKYSYLSL
ncbi:hypothetical protein II582_01880 [bacterium]|nr:hypothetical protein [bacterium]